MTSLKRLTLIVLSLIIATLTGCSSTPPPKKTFNNVCSIYDHDDDWQEAAEKSYRKWGTPPHVLMAMVHQESRFKPNAQPKREYALGMIPLPRKSSAYGYSQAKDGTWHDYMKATGNWGASRSDIEDSMDFIGWYNYQSYKRLKISRKDTYKLYLAYHEGQGGYSRRTYLKKDWLLKVAKKVSDRARMYKKQDRRC
ncbi:transglycosylase SLT domain-containing protein [Thiomicrorhabdus sp. Kp2]|uniref:transglycosylase SLT domain-containing protein n=1 Tax=Thiomicrorhabdus sp. Kp2 TaxID=1123518 RepID=UPI0004065ABA|nr:transglycosylase SLT domain-containing protein [Thiomicrorhabdus sp. Kp2]